MYALLCVACSACGSILWAVWCGGADDSFWYAGVVLFATGVSMNLFALVPCARYIFSTDEPEGRQCMDIFTGLNVAFIFVMQIACISCIAYNWDNYAPPRLDAIQRFAFLWAFLTATYAVMWLACFGASTLGANLMFLSWSIVMANTAYSLYYTQWMALFALMVMTGACLAWAVICSVKLYYTAGPETAPMLPPK